MVDLSLFDTVEKKQGSIFRAFDPSKHRGEERSMEIARLGQSRGKVATGSRIIFPTD